MPKRRPNLRLCLPKTPLQKNPVEEILKHMNCSDVETIYGNLTDNITELSYKNIGMFSDRHIIFVTEYNNISFENGGQLFYKSSGESRGTGLGGYWLPCNGIETIKDFSDGYTRLAKPEDIYIHHLPDEGTQIYTNIVTYGRFITKVNAMISKFLSQVEIPKLSNELITQEDIEPILSDAGIIPIKIRILSSAVANAAAPNGNGGAAIGGSKKRIRRKSKRKTRRKSKRKSKRNSKRKSKRKSRK